MEGCFYIGLVSDYQNNFSALNVGEFVEPTGFLSFQEVDSPALQTLPDESLKESLDISVFRSPR